MGKTLADQPFMLTDFSFNPYKFNKAVLNKVEPKKHPRSAMSPT
jgi:gamma-glutamyltranspeptidase/glutathione hydrolase